MLRLVSRMRAFVEQLRNHPTLGGMIVHQERLDGVAPRFAEPAEALPVPLAEALGLQGIDRLYSHQARGVDLARAGRNVLLVTPTASGKTLLFMTSVLESLQRDRAARALLLYPTKALARDQLAGFRSLAGGLGALNQPRFEIYDGDTPPHLRRKLKQSPPEALITNPDMLHMGLLSHHQDWESFLSELRWVIIDELHVYRGIFGAHVHHILARLQRICAKAGSHPQFIAASATVGNPAEFARTLVGQPFEVVEESGAPQAPREVVFFNPVGVSPYTVALHLLTETLRADLRTIAFTKARRVTELLYTWLARQAPELRHRVAPYRAGYLPQERRKLEARLFSGELTAILSTSALELGIDVGGLDVCLLVGYPGSLISSWQRIGRVGRQDREGLVLLVAMPDALDQYVVRHPELFFGRGFEHAVLDPWNPLIAGRHLVCAAAEAPLTGEELSGGDGRGAGLAESLVEDGRLVQDATGEQYFSFRRRPHRDVSPRSAGEPFTIVEHGSGAVLGSIDATRVYHECHPGAIYLHGGRSYLIRELDTERRRAVAAATEVDYYTVVLGDKETEILERLESKLTGPFPVGLGRLKVTVRIREYQKRRLFDGEPLSTHSLQVPPLVFETIGLWVELPPGLPAAYARRDLHFMGGIHATEHATIGLFPLLAIADRGDVGGISYTGHPQIGGPAIFIYDAVPGGAGLAARGFNDLELLLGRTLELVRGCACEDGCPGCIQSPKCGNGNKPLDKAAALLTMRLLAGETGLEELEVEAAPSAVGDRPAPFVAIEPPERRGHGITRAGNLSAEAAAQLRGRAETGRTLVFDLETQLSADEVGGWQNIPQMRLALAVIYDVERGCYRTYYEADVDRLLLDLVMADRVIGFNLDRFDLPVLSAYTEWDLTRIRTFDLLADIHGRLGFRLSLAHLCEVNLGQSKAGDGLQSLRWWKEGRIDLIEQYCRQDVELTRRLFEHGRREGYLLYRDHSERVVRLPVRW